MRISLVGTVHAESGRANAAELLAILESLQPDAIFAEIPSTHLDEYLDPSRDALESKAVTRYCVRHPAQVVAVDLDKPSDEFFRNSEEMFRKVERSSGDYRRLMDQHSVDTGVHGFPYLNSERCDELWGDIYAEVLATVNWIGDGQLRRVYELWSSTNDRRDAAMLKSIDDYCSRHAHSRAVLLVGAAHRRSIVEKVRGERGLSGVDWELEGRFGRTV